MTQQIIRVWITASDNPDFLSKFRQASGKTSRTIYKKKDIILLFRRDTLEFTLIGAYSGGLYPIYQINARIDPNMLFAVVPRLATQPRMVGMSVDDHDAILLNEIQWKDLRSMLSANNAFLAEFIIELEQRQLRSNLESGLAIVYDVVKTPFEIIKVSGKYRRILAALEAWRTRASNNPNEHPLSFVDDLVQQNLVREPEPQELTLHQRIMMGLYQDGAKEKDAFDLDFIHVGDGLRKVSGLVNPGVEHRMCILEDSETQKRLTLYYAHQEGTDLADLVSSDLIYESETHRSIVFVQYKSVAAGKRLEFYTKTETNQLRGLLKTCTVQGCQNCNPDQPGEYLPTHEMRLRDCPAFYKVVSDKPKIDTERNSVEGRYIQACLIHQTMEENDEKSVITDELRGMTLPSFFELLRNAQIGSRGSSYEKLQKRMEEHMRGYRGGQSADETGTATTELSSQDTFVTYAAVS